MDDEGEMKSAQASQVIGVLLMAPETEVLEKEQIRALDYFSDTLAYSEDFLPWPKASQN